MKSVLIFFLTLVLRSDGFFGNNKENFLHREPPVQISAPIAQDIIYYGYAPMRVNQFDPMDNQTFNMRYFLNKDHMVEAGPIFIFIGGEWTITDIWLRTGHMYDMAKNLSGLMIYTEHRYYGYSKPTLNLELDNMEWLSIEQALADLANFIIFIKKKIPEVQNSKVILTGCSYSGTIATWFMQKYPHMADGAWSMSAPLKTKLDFKEYKEIVSYAINEIGGSECSARIKNAILELEKLVTSSNYHEVERILNLCAPLNTTNLLDVWLIFSEIGNAWAGIVQYASRQGQQIEKSCRDLMSIETSSDAEALAKWFLNQSANNERCFDNRWSTFLYNFRGTEWSDWVANVSWRQWLYQSCTEFGWFQTSTSADTIFGTMIPPDFFLQFCMDLYDKSFTRDFVQGGINRKNIVYGALKPSVFRMYSTQGEFDPWRPVGISFDINEESQTVILPGESHCADMSSVSEWDTPEMSASKKQVFELVKQWVEFAN